MRKLTVLVVGMTLAMTALPAAAGVVITKKLHVTNGANSRDDEQTVSVQGNKQKIETADHTIITDLDKGVMYAINPKAKTYFEIEFPPKGPMGAMMAANQSGAMNFKKAGTTRKIAGYTCTDYNGGGHVTQGDYTVTECFSTTVPGAEEFSAFDKNMADKLKSAGANAITGETPRGVPLATESTLKMKMDHVSIPGMKPEDAAKLGAMMAKRPPRVMSQTVEKIESKQLADSDFAVPAGFTKQERPQPGLGTIKMAPGAKMGPGAAAPGAVAPGAAASPAAH
jgi:hypothetical protein